ncbi:hypothetical protein [Rathayibacter sp. AY1C4]|uniref:hypothetical protein n=1 Tax=Rathayibacter sp. AY1C4 TaxID=2080537 RepID=UPI0011B0D9F7|nr:hypothetical protein [Rathayibacter sp. AY1C4]
MSDIVDDFALVAASADALLKPIKDAVAALDVVLRQRSSAYRAGYVLYRIAVELNWSPSPAQVSDEA